MKDFAAWSPCLEISDSKLNTRKCAFRLRSRPQPPKIDLVGPSWNQGRKPVSLSKVKLKVVCQEQHKKIKSFKKPCPKRQRKSAIFGQRQRSSSPSFCPPAQIKSTKTDGRVGTFEFSAGKWRGHLMTRHKRQTSNNKSTPPGQSLNKQHTNGKKKNIQRRPLLAANSKCCIPNSSIPVFFFTWTAEFQASDFYMLSNRDCPASGSVCDLEG